MSSRSNECSWEYLYSSVRGIGNILKVYVKWRSLIACQVMSCSEGRTLTAASGGCGWRSGPGPGLQCLCPPAGYCSDCRPIKKQKTHFRKPQGCIIPGHILSILEVSGNQVTKLKNKIKIKLKCVFLHHWEHVKCVFLHRWEHVKCVFISRFLTYNSSITVNSLLFDGTWHWLPCAPRRSGNESVNTFGWHIFHWMLR